MIRLKVFISSVQKELRTERIAVGGFLATDEFLGQTTIPRIFEDYPQPLRSNPKAYLELLRQCQIYLLIIGTEYGNDTGDGLSATHEEYRLAQELSLPALICVKGSAGAKREAKTKAFLDEIKTDGHIYSRFEDEAGLFAVVGQRLREHIETTYDTVPKKAQIEQSERNFLAANEFERNPVTVLEWADLDHDLALDMMAAAEDTDKERLPVAGLPRLLLSRGYLWKDATDDVLRPTAAGALLLAAHPSVALPQARIQLDAYTGTDRSSDPIDSVFLDAPLAQVVEQTVVFIRRHTARPLAVKGLKRQNTFVYPPEALREVIVNAVAHRDYADTGAKVSVEIFANHLRVSSPGMPPGGQPLSRLATGQARSRSRNPLVVQGLSWLDLMDERGSGIRRMTRLLAEAGHPAPTFERDHDSVVVGFSARPEEAPVVTAPAQNVTGDDEAALLPREAILREAKTAGSITTRICVQRLGLARATAQRQLTQLVEEGLVVSQGKGRATSYLLSAEKVRRK